MLNHKGKGEKGGVSQMKSFSESYKAAGVDTPPFSFMINVDYLPF